MNNNYLEFDILKPQSVKALALLLSEFQARGVNFKVTGDFNLVTVEVLR